MVCALPKAFAVFILKITHNVLINVPQFVEKGMKIKVRVHTIV
jgi:hypothetical protein